MEMPRCFMMASSFFSIRARLPWDLDNAMTHELGPDERARAAQRRAEDADDDSLVLPPLRGRM